MPLIKLTDAITDMIVYVDPDVIQSMRRVPAVQGETSDLRERTVIFIATDKFCVLETPEQILDLDCHTVTLKN